MQNKNFTHDSRRPYSHVQVCELASLPLQASVYIHTTSNPLAVCVTDKCEFGYAHHTYLGFVTSSKNEGMYAAVLTNCEGNAEKIGDFATTLEAQAAILRTVCDTIKAWAVAAHASVAVVPTPTPENADLDFEYEALSAGSAFDNAEPTPISKHYELTNELNELNEICDSIATEQADDLAAIDSEITALKARLLALGSTRQDIVEEYSYWQSKAQQKINDLEYDAAYDSDEAQADLRQSIWFSTGQDIM